LKILIIPDTQVKPGVSIEHLGWVGQYIVDKRPDIIVNQGDHFDMPSLSCYDKGKASMEGRRVKEDIVAGKAGMAKLLGPLRRLQKQQKNSKKKVYKPEMHFLIGNHEQRIERHVESNPELQGFLSYKDLGLEQMGWKVHNFLDVLTIEDILFSHYFYIPNSGNAYGGTAHTKLKNIGKSFVMGHQQGLDMAMRTLADGSKQIGLVAGSCYMHDEKYKGPQANDHFRGIVMAHNVKDGNYDPCVISLDYLREKYA
jgi:hypothetical protein